MPPRKRTPAAVPAAAADRAAAHWASALLPLLAAPAGYVILAIAIIVMHHYWGGNPVRTPLVAVVVALSGVAASGYAWLAAGAHRTHLRGMATLTVGFGALATVLGIITGLEPIGVEYALGSVIMSVLWGIRHTMKAGGDGGHPLGQLGEAIGAERHHFFRIRRTGKGTVTAVVQATGGATIEDLQPRMAQLAAAAGVPRGGAVLRPDDDDASIGYLQVTVADLLKQTIAWPGPSRVGEVCTAPIPLGVYANGEAFEGSILTDSGDVEHDLIVGVTGSGKSEFCLVYLGALLMRRQVSTICIDCSKGMQTFGPIAHGVTSNGLLITDMRTARAVLKALAGPVTKARTEYLTSQGMTKWAARTPSGKKTAINFLQVWVEEAADLSDGESYAEMARRVRSAGIKIETSQQRAAWDEMATKTRANHGGGIAFGCRDEESARFCLPDDVVDAGALPLWRNRKPGYNYCAALGADPDNWTTVLRSYYLTDRRQLADAVTAAAGARDPMDAVTAKALGDLWDRRAVYAQPLGLAAGPAPAAAITGPGAPAPAISADHAARYTADALAGADAITDDDLDESDLEELMTQSDRHELDEATEDILGGLDRARRDEIDAALSGSPFDGDAAGEYDDPEDDLGARLPDTSDTVIDLDEDEDGDGGEVTAERAREMLCRQLEDWLRAGKRDFAPRDLYPLLERLGRGRRWFYHARDDLKEAGVIADGDDIGTYDILRSPFAGTEADL